MANTIKIARGAKASIPRLEDGQQFFAIDTNELFIGNNGTNVPIGAAGGSSGGSGGGGQMFQQMMLPPSSIYNAPLAWESIDENMLGGVSSTFLTQVIVGDDLWIIHPWQNSAVNYNLITKTYGTPINSFVQPTPPSGYTYVMDTPYAYVNGADIIYGCYRWTYSSSSNYWTPAFTGPNCINTVSRTVTPLNPLSNISTFGSTVSTSYNGSNPLVKGNRSSQTFFSHYYDEEEKKIVFFGSYNRTNFYRIMYDIPTNTYGTVYNSGNIFAAGNPSVAGQWFFQKKTDGNIYYMMIDCSSSSSSMAYIGRFSLSNLGVFTPMFSKEFVMTNPWYARGDQVGDKLLMMDTGRLYLMDLETFTYDLSQFPNTPTTMYHGYPQYNNNCYYYMAYNKLYKLPFYTTPPEDSPIICKIFAGQKYHGLKKLEIPGKVTFTTIQQTALSDISIRLGDYSSIGGYTIYVESGN